MRISDVMVYSRPPGAEQVGQGKNAQAPARSTEQAPSPDVRSAKGTTPPEHLAQVGRIAERMSSLTLAMRGLDEIATFLDGTL